MTEEIIPIDGICRACLKPTSRKYTLTGKLRNLDFTIADMLEFCTSKVPDLSEDLPDNVCTFCYSTLRMAYEFFRQFYKSQDQLIACKENESQIFPEYNLLGIHNYAEVVDNTEDFDADVHNESELDCDSDQIEVNDGDKITVEILQVEDSETQENNVDIHIEEPQIENTVERFSPTLLNPNCDNSNADLYPNVEVEPTVIIGNNENQDEQLFPYICPLCSTKFSRVDRFHKHILEHDQTVIICPRCDAKPEYNVYEYLEHYKEFHKLQCEICNKTLASTFGYRYHMKQHINTSCYKCPVKDCTRSFVLRSLLRNHVKNHYQPPVFTCHLCTSTFNTRDSLRYHLKKHLNKKDHLCTICGRAFYLAGHLTHHMYGHTGYKRYSCDICEKRFTTSTCLKKHAVRCVKKEHSFSVTNYGLEVVVDRANNVNKKYN